MKKLSIKGIMVLTLFLASVLAMPIMAFAQEDYSEDEDNSGGSPIADPDGFGDALMGFGVGGELIGLIFKALFQQSTELDEHQMLDGVYVLSAENHKTYNGSHDFATDGGAFEYHILPEQDLDHDNVPDYDNTGMGKFQYCVVSRTGSFNFSLEVGAQLTLIVWDNDGSFIRAAKKIINFAVEFNKAKKEGREESMAGEAAELLSWLIIHINEIFTGDELFVLNPITYQKLTIDPSPDFSITKTWYDSNDWMIGGDTKIDQTKLDEWNNTAKALHDNYMQWLLSNADLTITQDIWTTFSFDIIQLWVKNFEIHINVSELAKASQGENVNTASIFGGLDMDFYLFSHHLDGAFLYNDTDNNRQITVENYTVLKDENGDPVKVNNETVYVPQQSEITHRLMLGDVESFDFDSPQKKDDTTIDWGIVVNTPQIKAVPVGIDLNSYLGAPTEVLPFIEFKCQFVREEVDLFGNGTMVGKGSVKLEHNFGPWNVDETTGKTKGPSTAIGGLDMAIVYLSTIFHFHLNIQTEDTSQKPEKDLKEDFEQSSQEWKIGNYLSPDSSDKLDFIDIAGPGYEMSEYENKSNPQNYQPTSMIVPLGFWKFQGEKYQNNPGDVDTSEDDWAADINLDMSYNVMYYAVCYPDFNGTGMGIWHDPTFSVYVILNPSSAGFWALILLIAGVGLVGIATILIKRRKDNRF
ncbi:MAG: hypothetical protein ACTSRP_22080 [Candidatus Helarchaeota archaeon]